MPRRHLETNGGAETHEYLINLDAVYNVAPPDWTGLGLRTVVFCKVLWGVPDDYLMLDVTIFYSRTELTTTFRVSLYRGQNLLFTQLFSSWEEVKLVLTNANHTSTATCETWSFQTNDVQIIRGTETIYTGDGIIAGGDKYDPSYNRASFRAYTEHSMLAGGGTTLTCDQIIGWVPYRSWDVLYGVDAVVGWRWGASNVEPILLGSISVPAVVAPPNCSTTCMASLGTISGSFSWPIDITTRTDFSDRVYMHRTGICECPYDRNIKFTYRIDRHLYRELSHWCEVTPMTAVTDDNFNTRRYARRSLGCSIRPLIVNEGVTDSYVVEPTTYSPFIKFGKIIEVDEYCISGVGVCPTPPGVPALPCVETPRSTICYSDTYLQLSHKEANCEVHEKLHLDSVWDRKTRKYIVSGPLMYIESDKRPLTGINKNIIPEDADYNPDKGTKVDAIIFKNNSPWYLAYCSNAGDLRCIGGVGWGGNIIKNVIIAPGSNPDEFDLISIRSTRMHFAWIKDGEIQIKFMDSQLEKTLTDWTETGIGVDTNSSICLGKYPLGFSYGTVTDVSYIRGGRLRYFSNLRDLDEGVEHEISGIGCIYGVHLGCGVLHKKVFCWNLDGETSVKCAVYDTEMSELVGAYTIPGVVIDGGSRFSLTEAREREESLTIELVYWSQGRLRSATSTDMRSWKIW